MKGSLPLLYHFSAKEDLSEAGRVAQNVEDAFGPPKSPDPGAVSVCVQLGCNGCGTKAVVGAAIEDSLDEWELGGLDAQTLLGIEGEAVGDPSAQPHAPGGLPLHPVDDAVDDGGPFELGEDPKQLRPS